MAIGALLLPLLPNIINLVEGLIKRPGEKTGGEKMAAVMAMVKGLLEKLKDSKVIEDMPKDDTIKGIIEMVLGQLQVSGGLTGNAPATATAGAYLLRGNFTLVDLSKV